MAVLGVVILCTFGFNICHVSAELDDVIYKKHYVYWPNATVPFYINPAHFDRTQTLSIMMSLSMFAFKTCVKFLPVMAAPRAGEHVLVLQNPGGLRQCRWSTEGHSMDEPHFVDLSYQCLKSPQIEMTIMKALGFPFEHNRASRDLFIDVQYENIEPDAIDLFSKDTKLPLELRNLPYDFNSVMHFGDRDFSKNGHRTIITRDPNVKQNRKGLSEVDLRKIEIVYGPECQKRDRQEKIDLCQLYPRVARKKREVDLEQDENLRVNRDITPPPNKNLTDDIVKTLKELGIVKEVEGIVDAVYKVVAVAVENAKKKYCNVTKDGLRSSEPIVANFTITAPSIQSIIESIVKFSQSFVDVSMTNLTVFCDSGDVIETYQRIYCHPNIRDPRCPSYYKSTKSGPVVHYTQHRPLIRQSTKHNGRAVTYQYGRSGNNTEDYKNETVARKKRAAHWENVKDKELVKKEVETIKKADHKAEAKPSLRSATAISIKREHYAPFRRSDRRFRIYSRKDKKSEKSVSDSQDNSKRDRKPKQRGDETEYSEEEMEKPKLRPIAEKYDKPKKGGKRKIPQTVKLLKKNKEFYADRVWPGGVVRYVITEYDQYDLSDLRARIQQVNDILTNKTCVRVEELSDSDAKKHNDYLVLDTSPDYVTGRVGGRQVFGSIELFKGVSHKQHTAMMVMAWLGFYFEVSRHDRDDHVVVHNRHIRPDKLHHFEKVRSDATLAVPYDYKSATHPSWQFWRKIGKTGISVVATHKDQDPDGSIMRSFGQNPQLLSDLDIIRINSIYGVKCFKKAGRHRS